MRASSRVRTYLHPNFGVPATQICQKCYPHIIIWYTSSLYVGHLRDSARICNASWLWRQRSSRKYWNATTMQNLSIWGRLEYKIPRRQTFIPTSTLSLEKVSLWLIYKVLFQCCLSITSSMKLEKSSENSSSSKPNTVPLSTCANYKIPTHFSPWSYQIHAPLIWSAKWHNWHW